MSLLRPQLLLLTAILNDILYITPPHSVNDVYVCFSENATWPAEWTKMEPFAYNVHTPTLMVTLPKNTTGYKLRLVYANRTYTDSSWTTLNTPTTTLTNSSSSSIPTMVYYLLHFISFGVSLLVAAIAWYIVRTKI